MKKRWINWLLLLLSLQLAACYPRRGGRSSRELEIMPNTCCYLVNDMAYKDSIRRQYRREARALTVALLAAQKDTITRDLKDYDWLEWKIYEFLTYIPMSEEAEVQAFNKLGIHPGQAYGPVQTDVRLEYPLKPPFKGHLDYRIQYGRAVQSWRAYVGECAGYIERVKVLKNDFIPDSLLAAQRLVGASEFKVPPQ